MSDEHEHIPAGTPLHGTRRFAVAAAFVAGMAMLPATATYAADSDTARPMGGSCETTFVFTGPTTAHYEGSCSLLHLGLTHVVAAQAVTFNADGTLHIVDVAIYTSANGDALVGYFDGVGTFTSSTEVSFVGTETYNGGTGRFADASGNAVITGVAMFTSPNGGIGEYTGKGFLSY
jgi:hypothetical protein